jgi:ubiquinone/menaquinone biosynthesis C-methylase UbiE
MPHMPRRPEPELMNGEEQARAYSEADFTSAHEGFVALCRERVGPLDEDSVVLDLGCGPADVTVRFARAYAGVTVDGVDGAPRMLALGRERVAREGLASRVTLHEGYVPGCTLPRETYDAVISNSLLHHLRDPHALWTTVKRTVRPGAPVFIMDLLRPATDQQATELVARYAGGEPDILREDFYASLHAAYTLDEVRSQTAAHGLSSLTVEAVSDRHLIVVGRMPLVT